MSIIPALGSLRQEDGEFETNLGCTVRPCPKYKIKQNKKLPNLLCDLAISALDIDLRIGNRHLNKCMHTYVPSNAIHNGQKEEIVQMSVSR
jgi:hypothetical protein